MTEYIGAATATNATGVTQPSIDIAKPAGTTEGDLMIATLYGGETSVITPPPGWTFIGKKADTGSHNSWAFYKTAGQSEAADYPWTYSVDTAKGGAITTWRGASGIDVWWADEVGGTQTPMTPTVTCSATGRIFRWYAWRSATTTTCSTTANVTEAFDIGETDGLRYRGCAGYVYGQDIPAQSPAGAIQIDPSSDVTNGVTWTIMIIDADSQRSREQAGASVELNIDGGWIDVTSHVRYAEGVSISRGRSAEGNRSQPSRCTMTLDNRDGRFSPRNPLSPYYGKFGRNTPIRVYKGETFLHAAGTDADKCSTPASIADGITGDIDIRIDAEADNWTGAEEIRLAGRYSTTGENRSWSFYSREEDLGLGFQWSPDGTAASLISSACTVPLPRLYGRFVLRVTLDVDNGAGGWTVNFYTGESLWGPWTKLGADVTGAGVTSIFNGGAALEVGSTVDAGGLNLSGKVYGMAVLSGIDSEGYVVANPNFKVQDPGVSNTSFTDTAGRTWTLLGDSFINRHNRFYGEVSEWPVSWDRSGKDVTVDIEANGPMRRVIQGVAPSKSLMRRQILAGVNGKTPVAYWPMEVDGQATSAPSIVGNAPDLNFVTLASAAAGEGVKPAAYDGIAASDPLPNIANGLVVSNGFVRSVSLNENDTRLTFVMYAPDGITHGGRVAGISWYDERFVDASGSVNLVYTDFATWQVDFNNNHVLTTIGPGTFRVDKRHVIVQIQVEDVTGSGVGNIVVKMRNVGDSAYTTVLSYSGWDYPRASRGLYLQFNGDYAVGINTPVHIATDLIFGHVALWSGPGDIDFDNNMMVAYEGEGAAERIIRLCDENGTPVSTHGSGASLMGTQPSKTFMELVRECEDADAGILGESRSPLGLWYRTRASMCTQDPIFTLDYDAAEIGGSLAPVDDDKNSENRVTVQNTSANSGGYEVTVEKTDGAMSSASPPDGIGLYEATYKLNLYRDAQVRDCAGWRLHRGTQDEARYPNITANLNATSFREDLSHTYGALEADLGDVIEVVNLPDWLPDRTARLIVEGYSEKFDPSEHTITFHCSPAELYDVAEYDHAAARYDTSGSELASDFGSGDTVLGVSTTNGPVWYDPSPTGDSYDIVVGGERMTVTNVTGTTSPQTFTVIRSVNEVVKSHPAGTSVRLYRPSFYGF